MLQEAASVDRWTSKVLAYPCFGFREAIASTRLVNLQFVLAVDVTSAEQFAAKVFEWTSASAHSAHEQLQQRTQMLEQFWLSGAVSLRGVPRLYQMGFARCAKVPRQRLEGSIAEIPTAWQFARWQLPRRRCSFERRPVPWRLLRRVLDLEPGEKPKWAKRLQDIADQAGDRAMANHIRKFEKFEMWAARSSVPYPISDDKVLKYGLFLGSVPFFEDSS